MAKKTITIQKEITVCDQCGNHYIETDQCVLCGKDFCWVCTYRVFLNAKSPGEFKDKEYKQGVFCESCFKKFLEQLDEIWPKNNE